MLNDFMSLTEEIDNPYTFGAFLIMAALALLWRFLDKKLLTIASQVGDGAEKTAAISEAIRTNHGSKSLGDAIDRLTEHSFIQLELWSKTDKWVHKMDQAFLEHIEEHAVVADWVRKKMLEEAEVSELADC